MLITPSNTLQRALAQFHILRIAFAHEFVADWAAEAFKGNLWHGLFGACLYDIDQQAYQALYGLDEAQRRWALIPPLTTEPWIPKHVPVQAGITLFGRAIAHTGAVIQALKRMGQKGFGRDRIRATLVEVGAIGMDDDTCDLHSPTAIANGWDIWLQAQQAMTAQPPTSIDVHLLTPLRFKSNGQVNAEPPTLETLIRRCMGRLVLLSPVLPGGVFGEGDQRMPLELGQQCDLVAVELINPTWPRRSSRQQRTMPFEGLMGYIRYAPPASHLLPWLELAHWMQLGSKTSFGLGMIEAHPVGQQTMVNPYGLAGA